MIFKAVRTLCFFLCPLLSFVQESNYLTSISIPLELRQDANAVVRFDQTQIVLESFDKMKITERRIVTVLNGEGAEHINAYVHYDENVRIKELEATIYDAFGKKIKRIKEKDFKDVSAVDGATLYSDSRVKYLDYTPVQYPYTVELNSEIVTNNTAFIPWFYPVGGYYLSVENSIYQITNPTNLKLRFREFNLGDYEVDKQIDGGNYKFTIKNSEVIEPESHSPLFSNIAPKVMFASNSFHLEGVSGEVQNWKDFGKWMYDHLLADTQLLPDETINEVKALVEGKNSVEEKAKVIYKYVQDKTRYISVQVGIGGWKPFDAIEVDRLGYGDCKALTNYTMALLKAVGVDSYYSVVFGGNSQKNIVDDFASIQGNHVILNIPIDEENVWLECTSQKLPFGFIGDFTDDRDVLVVTPEGGLIKRTKKYGFDENTQLSKAECHILPDGGLKIKSEIISKGIQYDNKYYLDFAADRDIDQVYKKRWSYLNGLKIDKYDIQNDKDSIQFKEVIEMQTAAYGNQIGERMLVAPNIMNRNTYIPDRYRNRNLPLVVKRGFVDRDEIKVHLPEGYKLEGLPENQVVTSKFGTYKSEIIKISDTTLLYKRELVLKDFEFEKEEYKNFRDFYKTVTKFDNSKIALKKSI